MGNASSITTTDPFPVNAKILTNLSRMTYGTARILNTEDIYNLFNLNVQGPCGNYVIFKKKNIGIKLLPFITDVSGVPQEFLYQDSLKSVGTDMRKEVCKQLSYTMLRTIATIVACLASMQYDHPQVKTLLGKIPKPMQAQRGGSDRDIRPWLERHNFITKNIGVDGDVYSLYDRPTMLLTFTDQKGYSIEATLTDATQAKTIRLEFLAPVVIDAPERGVVVGMTDMQHNLACGILYNEEYVSFSPRQPRRSFGEFCQKLMTSQILTEPAASYRLFNEIKKLMAAGNDKAIPVVLQQYFSSIGSAGLGSGSLGLGGLGLGGLGLGGLDNRSAAVLAALGGQGALARPQGLGFGGLNNQIAARSLQAVLGYQRAQSPVGAFPFANIGADTGGPIKGPAQKYIHDYFEKCRRLMSTEDSPAAKRVRVVVAGDDQRKARTDICRDPYWQKTNLSEVYPWATLQFMCVKEWNSVGTPDVKLDSDFDGFLSNLKELYTGDNLPKLVAKNKGNRLEDLHFSGMSAMPLCRSGKETFNIKAVQDLLVKMNQLYTNHVTAMSAIINSLIIEIDDQGTNVYRLHPQIFKSGKPTADFINEKAREARTKLIAFYIQVETIYIEIIKRLS